MKRFKKKKKFKTSLALGMTLCFVLQGVGSSISTVYAMGKEEDPDVVLAYKTHFDIGFTDFAKNVIRRYRTTFIDNALKSIDESSSLPEDEQFKWILPGWPLAKIMEDWSGQTEERKEKIDEAIENERILVHGLPFSLESESLDLEDMVRSMNYSSEIARKYGKDLPISGKMTDVPEQSWILPTLLKHAGIEFLHLGCNPASTPPDVPPLFWWEGPDGSRVLTMYSKDYGVGALPPEDWPYDVWLGLKMTGDNAGPPSISDVENDIAQVENNGRTYTIGSLDDFAKEILSKDTSNIPVIRGDMPDTWIHGIMAAPNETKIARNMRPKIYQLDSLNTMLNMMDLSDLNVDNIVRQAYDDALRFGEHTWGFNEHIEDYEETFRTNKENGKYEEIEASWEEKLSLANNIQNEVEPVLKKNMETLAQNVNSDKQRIVVYNSLPWERSGKVKVEFNGEKPESLINSETKEVVAVDSIDDGYLTFTAKNIPSMGYATYEFSNEKVTNNTISVDEDNNVIENKYFRITLDPSKGSIVSIINKKDNTEMIDQNNEFGFSQYLNERFSNDDVLAYNKAYNTQHGGWAYDDMSKTGLNTEQYKNVEHENTVADNLEISYETNNDSVVAVMKGQGVDNRYEGMELRITLHADQEYIDIDWAVNGKVEDPWPMADWLTFPFEIEDPEYRLYRLGGVMDPANDIVKDTQTNNLALDGGMTIVGKDGKGIGLCSKDAPLVSIGKPGIWEFDKGEGAFNPEEPTVFLNLFNNQWDTNYPTWNGGNWATNVKIWAVDENDYEKSLVTPSNEIREPLIAAYASENGGNAPLTKEGIKLSSKGVEVTAFGPNIDGDGTILRLWEQSGKDQKITVTLPKELKATRVTPVNLRGEEIGKAIKVRNNQFEIEIGKNAPFSLKLDYELEETEIDDVADISITDINEDGTIQVNWENPLEYNYNKVYVEYKNEEGDGNSILANAEDKKITIEGLTPGSVYSVTIKGKDIAGNLSEGITKKHKIAGAGIIEVADATSSNSFPGYSPINLVNKNGLTGGNPKTAVHDNDRSAYSMWHTNGNPGEGTWVEFDFGEEKIIDEMYIWNMNQMSDSNMTDRGFKNVKIQYSSDKEVWNELEAPADIQYKEAKDAEYPFQLAKASGENGILATNLNTENNEPISFNGVNARYVRIIAKDSWGSEYWGLSEVMFTNGDNRKIQSLEQESVSTVIGRAPELPSKVTAILEDNNTRSVNVDWDAVDESMYEKENEFIVYGSVYGSDIKAECKVTVEKCIQPQNKVTDVNIIEQDGNATLTWKDPQNIDFEKIIIKYENLNEVKTIEIDKGIQELSLSDLKPGMDYKIELWASDKYGYKSDPEEVYYHVKGSAEIFAKSALATDEWGAGVNATNTINKSGISGTSVENYTHDNDADAKTMWHTRNASEGVAVTYDFGMPKTVDKMYVWNMNQSGKSDRGLKNVKIEYSLDGEEWNTLTPQDGLEYLDEKDVEYPFQLAKASGENNINATNLNTENNDPITFNEVATRYVRITAKDSWGSQYWGLSEVAFTEADGGEIATVENVNAETVIGQYPQLPTFVNVTYENQSQGMKAVKWDSIDPSILNEEGEYSISGKIIDTEMNVLCTLKVNKIESTVNKKDLIRLINIVIGKEEIAYSTESWSRLMDIFNEANIVFEDSNATQERVDEVSIALENSIKELELIVSPEKLDLLINLAENMLKNADIYTGDEGYEGQVSQSVYDALKDILESSKESYLLWLADLEDGNMTEYDKGLLAEIMIPLNQAIDDFNGSIVHIQFNDLYEIVAEANKLNKGRYTIESWLILENEMKDIENLLSHPEVVKQSEVNIACEELKKAIEQLIVNPNLSSLKALIEKAEKIDLTLYQQEGRKELEEALKVAKEQLENPTSEQTVKEAMDRLEAAINNLKLIPSKSALSELIDKVSGLNKEEYTEETWNNVESALKSAKSVLADENATQEEINEAVTNLESALHGLIKKDKDEEKPGDGNDNNSNSGNDNNGGNYNNDGTDNGGNLPLTGGTSSVTAGLIGLMTVLSGTAILRKKNKIK